MTTQTDTEQLISDALSALAKLSTHFQKRRERLDMYEANKAWQIIHALTDREKRRQRIMQDLTPL